MKLRTNSARRRSTSSLQIETLEGRDLMSASPLPVLLVIADQQDFYFQEYNDTRTSLLARNVDVVVAATTTNVSVPHPGSGQAAAGVSGEVRPDIALADVDPADYSAIAFVGGWGSSMCQYAYNDPNGDGVLDNYYWNWQYNGDTSLNGDPNHYDGAADAQKVIVNNLINEFLADDKYVAAICHGVTVLAWARVDGVSPLAGKHVSVPINPGAPSQFYDGDDRAYPNYGQGQREQVLDNGGLPNTLSGEYGVPGTNHDDVVVDGRIITAEDYNSALEFGNVIAREVKANLPPDVLPPASMIDGNIVLNGTDGDDVIYIWSSGSVQGVSAWINGTSYGPFQLGTAGRVIAHGGAGNDQIFATDTYAPRLAVRRRRPRFADGRLRRRHPDRRRGCGPALGQLRQ